MTSVVIRNSTEREGWRVRCQQLKSIPFELTLVERVPRSFASLRKVHIDECQVCTTERTHDNKYGLNITYHLPNDIVRISIAPALMVFDFSLFPSSSVTEK